MLLSITIRHVVIDTHRTAGQPFSSTLQLLLLQLLQPLFFNAPHSVIEMALDGARSPPKKADWPDRRFAVGRAKHAFVSRTNAAHRASSGRNSIVYCIDTSPHGNFYTYVKLSTLPSVSFAKRTILSNTSLFNVE